MHPTSKPSGLIWLMHLPIGIGLLIAAGLVGYGYHTGERLHEAESPFLKILSEIRIESEATRIWVEDELDHAERPDQNISWDYLEHVVADNLRQIYMLYEWHMYGRLPPSGLSMGDFEGLSQAIEHLAAELAGSRDAWASRDQSPAAGQSTDLRRGLHEAFAGFTQAISVMEARVRAELELKQKRFRSIQAVLVGTCILLAIGVAAAARHNTRERSAGIAGLTAMNRQLQEEISQRKTVETTLADRERLLRKVFNESPVSILVARLADMRIVDVNEWFVAATGFEKEEILRRHLQDVVVCRDPQGGEEFRQLMNGQKQLNNIECQLPVKKGAIRTALLSSTLIDLNGEAHILSAARDITEFKKTEQTLHQSEQRFRSLVESAPDFIHLMDPQGMILLANLAACRRLGYASEDIVGRPLTDFLSPESGADFRNQFPALLAQGELRAEYDMVARTGEVIPVDCSATTVKGANGGGAFVVFFQKDITERRRNEQKFKAMYRFLIAANQHQELQPILEDFLSALVEATGCDAAAVRVEDDLLAKAFIAVRGFDVSTCQQRGCMDSRMCNHVLNNAARADADHRSPKGSCYCNSADDMGPRGGDGGHSCPLHPACAKALFQSYAVTPVSGPNGRSGIIHIAYRARNKVSGEIIGLVEAAALQLSTVIQRLSAEHALQCSHDELERRVRERTEELSIINERLKAEVLERTLTEQSLMHHQQQLRQLSSVLVQTEERERRRIATAIHDGVGQTLAAAKIKMGAIQHVIPPEVWEGKLADVRGLISLAIEESRSLTFELSPPVLYEIGLQSALEWIAERFQRKFGLPISVDGDGSNRGLCIPHRVLAFQSVRELCFNAIKHAQASRIEVFTSEAEEGLMRIDVFDDGIGFDVKDKREAGKEMGFGLFSMREQLRHHGGTLTLDSQPGKGTRVTLRLPMNAPEDR